MMSTLFLDLEGTIVNELGSSLIIPNVNAIKNFIDEKNIDELIIFSWAIFDDADLMLAEEILTHFDVTTKRVLTVKQQRESLAKVLNLTFVTEEDLFNFFTKESLFVHIAPTETNSNFIALIDDTVQVSTRSCWQNDMLIINISDIVRTFS